MFISVYDGKENIIVNTNHIVQITSNKDSRGSRIELSNGNYINAFVEPHEIFREISYKELKART